MIEIFHNVPIGIFYGNEDQISLIDIGESSPTTSSIPVVFSDKYYVIAAIYDNAKDVDSIRGIKQAVIIRSDYAHQYVKRYCFATEQYRSLFMCMNEYYNWFMSEYRSEKAASRGY